MEVWNVRHSAKNDKYLLKTNGDLVYFEVVFSSSLVLEKAEQIVLCIWMGWRSEFATNTDDKLPPNDKDKLTDSALQKSCPIANFISHLTSSYVYAASF